MISNYHKENEDYFTEVAGFVPSLPSRHLLGQRDGKSKVQQLMDQAGYVIGYPAPANRLNAIIGFGQNIDLIIANQQPKIFTL